MADLDKRLHDVTSMFCHSIRHPTMQSNVIRVFNAFITNSILYYLDSNILQSSREMRSSQSCKISSLPHKKATHALCFQ